MALVLPSLGGGETVTIRSRRSFEFIGSHSSLSTDWPYERIISEQQLFFKPSIVFGDVVMRLTL